MKETGLKDGYLVGFFYQPEKNLPIEKVILMSRLVNKYKNVLLKKRDRILVLLLVLPPLCDDHVCAYTCVSLSFIRKWNKNRFVNNHLA